MKKTHPYLSPALVALSIAGACSVVDKADYTFDDTPDGDGGEGDETGGRGGRGGASGGGTAGKGGTSSKGGTAGNAGTSGAAGSDGGAGDGGGETGGSGGSAGKGGTGGKGGTSGKGGTGGSDPCDPDPCEHGTCSPDGSGYDCDCEAGYEGDDCETNIDDCNPNPCQNLGICADALDDFRCTCQNGFTGETCESGGPCDPNPCQHGGTCNVVRSTYLCSCRQGSVGTDCERFGPDCRAMRSGGVATTNGAYQIDPGSGTIEVYCDMNAGGVTYEELAMGHYDAGYQDYELMGIPELRNAGIQQAFIWAYNRQGGMTNLIVGDTDTNCCFKGGPAPDDYFSIGTGAAYSTVFPADFAATGSAWNCSGPYNDPTMRFFTWATYSVQVPPLPTTFFMQYPVGGTSICSEGRNPGFFFKRH